jgi:hypothetical protein
MVLAMLELAISPLAMEATVAANKERRPDVTRHSIESCANFAKKYETFCDKSYQKVSKKFVLFLCKSFFNKVVPKRFCDGAGKKTKNKSIGASISNFAAFIQLRI